MPFKRQMIKQTIVHPYHVIPFTKNEFIIDEHNRLDEFPGNNVDWKKTILNVHMLHECSYITFWNDTLTEIENILVVARGQGQENWGENWYGF